MEPWATGEYAGPRKGLSPVKVFKDGRETYRVEGRFHWVDLGQGPYFSVTCRVQRKAGRDRWVDDSFGPQSELLAKHFPKLAHLSRWHLVDYATGPMHYIANTVYLAGDKDHNGKRAGEPLRWETVAYIGDSPVSHRVKAEHAASMEEWQAATFDHDDYGPTYIGADPAGPTLSVCEVGHERDGHTFGSKFYIAEFQDSPPWHACQFDSQLQAREWRAALLDPTIAVRFVRTPSAFSEGKAPELDAARRVAVWPEATAEQLTDPEVLAARLPALLVEMRSELEAAGIDWPTVWLSDASN